MAINTEAVLIGKERRQAYLDPLLSLLPVQPEAELERSPRGSWSAGRICFPPFSL